MSSRLNSKLSTFNSQLSSGFSLVEFLVAVAVFSFLVSVLSDLFLSNFMNQRRALSAGVVQEQNSFLAEYLSRTLRMARKDVTGSCIPAGSNYQKTSHGSTFGVKFLNNQSTCQEFYLDPISNRLKENKGGTEQYLTSAAVAISVFRVNLIGETQSDQLQPRVTLFWRVSRPGAKAEAQTLAEMQVTVSQRKLDVPM